MNTKYLITVVGPTAIGKTALGIKLAKHFGTEIISADSRQFFKEMSIGTAAPTAQERSDAVHHFIHHKSIQEDYNVGAFEKEALDLLNQLFLKNDIVVMVGGSGLYVDAVLEGLDDFPEIDPNIRESLNQQLKSDGLEALQERLRQLDPESYRTIALDNPHRVIRALEVCLGTGTPYSTFLNKAKPKRPFASIIIGLTTERSHLYERINHRVDLMMQEGLLEEARALWPHQHLNALQTVGYKELFNYLDGIWTFEFAVSEIKKNSRRYAKRQLTWFRKNSAIQWFEFDADFQEIIDYIEKKRP